MEFLIAIFFFGMFAVWIGSIVYWIMAIVEVVKIPEQQYRAAGTEKTVWILVVVLVGIIGALIWYFAKRQDVLAAAGQAAAAPPGWYPDPTTGAQRWWDGVRWTESQQAPPPPGF